MRLSLWCKRNTSVITTYIHPKFKYCVKIIIFQFLHKYQHQSFKRRRNNLCWRGEDVPYLTLKAHRWKIKPATYAKMQHMNTNILAANNMLYSPCRCLKNTKMTSQCPNRISFASRKLHCAWLDVYFLRHQYCRKHFNNPREKDMNTDSSTYKVQHLPSRTGSCLLSIVNKAQYCDKNTTASLDTFSFFGSSLRGTRVTDNRGWALYPPPKGPRAAKRAPVTSPSLTGSGRTARTWARDKNITIEWQMYYKPTYRIAHSSIFWAERCAFSPQTTPSTIFNTKHRIYLHFEKILVGCFLLSHNTATLWYPLLLHYNVCIWNYF